MNNIAAITALMLNRLPVRNACNLKNLDDDKALDNEGLESLDYKGFIDDFSHGNCDVLAFWLHDNFDLKMGAVRAIDMNNESDTEYETVVHQYVYIGNGYVLDARGIDTQKAMLTYYQDESICDDEDWDFMIDDDFKHDPARKQFRQYDPEDVSKFKAFLSLLDKNIRNQFQHERIRALDSEASPAP